jgi:alkylation response protein AidB-like acyl-CoA dehydrogenase
MQFHASEEQLAMQASVRGTLADTFSAERLRNFLDTDRDYDAESWNALMALGLGGLAIPEAAGGSGLGLLDAALVLEVLGEGAAAGPFAQHLVAGLALSLAEDETARRQWLPQIVSGETVATLALGGDWLPETWTITVEDGAASGTVHFVPAGCSAGIYIVGTIGGGLALVPAGDHVTAERLSSSDRTRRLATLTFDRAPATLLFVPGDPSVARLFDAALTLTAADALGAAQHCVDASVSYALERQQFGQVIGRFQALKHQLATMALHIEPARALVWYAAYAWDARLDDGSRAAALAKAHLADRFVAVTRDAIAAHGGIGYTWEYLLHVWFRRALFDRAYLGSPATHRARAADLAGW